MSAKKRKILYVSGSRAEYGLMRETLLAIRRHPSLDLEIAVTGMHLMPRCGMTINDIKKDKFKVYKVEAIYRGDRKESMVRFIGEFIPKFLDLVVKRKPDVIFIQGDRSEMLAAATVGAYLTIPVVHTHGGDITSTVDEFARHAITKLSHVHLPASKKSAERIIRMGEDPKNVCIVGAPGLDSIVNQKLMSKAELSDKYNLDFSKPVILALQHPVTLEISEAPLQIKQTLEALSELGHQTILIYPNADAGGRAIIKMIEKYGKNSLLNIYKNIPSRDYLSLLKNASAMVGNSSSGIIESIPFALPVVNIGSRQLRRERSINVIDVGYDKAEIKKAILKSLNDKKYREKIKRAKNPYGDGKAAQRITRILAELKINNRLLQKQITY